MRILSCYGVVRGCWRRLLAAVALVLIVGGSLSVPIHSASAQPSAAGVVSQREADGVLFLHNAEVEVGVERASGKLASLRDLRSGRQWLQRPVFPVQISLADTADIWRATPQVGAFDVSSSGVQVSFVSDGKGKAIEVAFERMAGSGKEHAVAGTYRVKLEPKNAETHWSVTLRNNTQTVVVDVFFPMLPSLAPLPDAELIQPHMAGLRTRVSELRPVLKHYPHMLSMPWFDVANVQDGLYLASQDLEPRSVWLFFADGAHYANRANGGASGSWIDHKGWNMALVRKPFLKPGANWTSPDSVVMPHQDGWHAAARSYRRFFQSNFSTITVSPLVRRLGALSSVHLKTPWVEFKEARGFSPVLDFEHNQEFRNRGIRGVRLDGWAGIGFDTFVPGFAPMKEIGGAKAFAGMVKQAKQRGINVYPYMNPRLVSTDDGLLNRFDPSAVALREQCAVRKVDGSVYTEEYKYKGYGDYKGVVMCLRCQPWLDHFHNAVQRMIDDAGVSGLFVDQFGLGIDNGLLCFNKNHGHPTPADVWGPGTVKLAEKLHRVGRASNPNFLIFAEGNFDQLFRYLDLPFSWSDESRYLPGDGTRRAPEVIRYTFDDLAAQKFYSHANSGGLGTVLMTANVIDSGGHPIRSIQERVPEVFLDGRYTDTIGIKSTPASSVRVVGFVAPKKFALGVMTQAGKSGTFSMEIDLAAMNVGFTPRRATLLGASKKQDLSVPFENRGGKLAIDGVLPKPGVPVFVLFE